MSAESTIHLIESYTNEATPVPFLTNFFQSPDRNFHTSEKVELDIIRDEEEVAIVVQDLTTGTRENELAYYQTKAFTPPVYDESATISAFELMGRMQGGDVYQDPDFNANATLKAFRIMRKLEAKIRRAVELQAAQVLQTGKLTLVDSAGRALFALDFGPRVAHFPTVGANWGSGSDDPVADIGALGEAVRTNGRMVPKTLIFGKRAWRRFFDNAKVRALFNILRVNVGQIQPTLRTGGGSFKGTLTIDNYDYELYVYDGTYVDPQTRAIKNYVDQDNVIMISENARLDLTFGAIPLITRPEDRALSFLPPRISSGDRRLDLTVNAWITSNNKHLKLECGTRPLTIPTAIDSFGCLKTAV